MRIRIARRAGLGISLAALGLGGANCGGPGDATAPPPDVLLVLVDTLRKDHVGTYGYARETTPALDAVAAEGLVFENAVAQSSWTRPSVVSLFTSQYHSRFHPDLYLRDGEEWKFTETLGDGALTLAEIFAANGYRTVSVVTNMLLHEHFNLVQGFEERVYENKAPADWVVDRALERLEAGGDGDDRPVFLYLHFMDPHAPLAPPEPYATMFPTLDGRPHRPAHAEKFPFADFATPQALRSRGFRVYRSHVLALYDGTIRFVDAELGRLVERLRERGRWERTLFAFLSDHGEAFWDRPLLEKRLGLHSFLKEDRFGVGHGHTLFPELVEVPLVLAGPGLPEGRVPQQVRLLDVAPTLLGLAGATHPGFEPRGVNLVARLREGALGDLPAVSETRTRAARQRSVRDGAFQYLRLDGERELLFEHAGGRFAEVTQERPEAVAGLRDALAAASPSPSAGGDGGSVAPLDPELCRGLAALGYVEPERCAAEAP